MQEQDKKKSNLHVINLYICQTYEMEYFTNFTILSLLLLIFNILLTKACNINFL